MKKKVMKKEPALDGWTGVHVAAGFILFMLLKFQMHLSNTVSPFMVLLVLLGWEVSEYFHTPEYYKLNLDNNVADVLADIAGILLALAVFPS